MLEDLINSLIKLHTEHGNIPVMATVGSSGTCYEVSSPHISEVTGDEESGPVLDMEPGEKYVDIYLGN